MTLEDSRLYIFVGLVALLALAEFIFPIYKERKQIMTRWLSNFSLSFINVAVLRLIFPFLAAQFAIMMSEYQIGMLNVVGFSGVLTVILAIILLDLAIYWQHILSHKWPLLWRLHKVHHSDQDIDLSTAIRFHPLEIMLSMGFKFILIAIIGAPVLAVVIFELILSSGSLFNHSNIRFSARFDRLMQWVVVTPNMHRIHHSDQPIETNSNYGFSISLWDRLFGSYIPNFDADRDIKIGLQESAEQKTNNLFWCLIFPFKK